MTLRDFVREYRETHGISQRQFAVACNLSNGYISMLEKNINPKTGLPVTPSIPALKKIATGMNISLNDLLIQVDDMSVDLSAYLGRKKAPTFEAEDGCEFEAKELFAALPEGKKAEALNYLRYLAGNADD